MGIFKYIHVDGQAEKVSLQHEIDWEGEERGLETRGNGENSRHLMSKIELGLPMFGVCPGDFKRRKGVEGICLACDV